MIKLNNSNSMLLQLFPKSFFALIRGPNMTFHQSLGPEYVCVVHNWYELHI